MTGRLNRRQTEGLAVSLSRYSAKRDQSPRSRRVPVREPRKRGGGVKRKNEGGGGCSVLLTRLVLVIGS
jgi:hypothetical protein